MRAIHTWTLLIVLAGLLLLGISCTKEESSQVSYDEIAAATDYTQVVSKAVEIVRSPLRDRVVGSGTIQAREEAVVKALGSGVIKTIDFTLGMKLEKGQVLLTLDDTIASLSLSQLTKQYENSLKELQANQKLYDRGAISLVQLEGAKANYDGIKAQLQKASDSLGYTKVFTPLAGSVAERNPQLVVGDFLQTGQQIARIVNLDHLRITLAVGQSQLFLVHEGAKAFITIKTPTETIEAEGVVSAISAASNTQTGSWAVLIDFDNPRPELIRAGLSANVTILNEKAPLYNLVPNSAMVYRDNSTFIYLVDGTNAKKIEVQVVDQYGDNTAVESVDPSLDLVGRRVLVSGLTRILDGDPVVTQY
ncbi:RND family efflux transporter, MFP subunit [Sphaerochaeta pleomorpha str. Grapes]|uniref:RND family efflux transporter, MFP subunit n=1 Tax=Sphaerochaeta pleomorpha (strain ATCC BAA-1885 / DSM 22778 / Grapes) TaxID=158190 RepID=G8QQ61_SPHPG|nr:efflux RND transporter periplasmic adaptor subunit [Sphaerochaeta pleomorpha]AEV28638.1 RND family efflux transporter, MFP subunit [Sphaerochaeta pleomorpha str. Grapes]